jgi:predicted histone-like DNA-binding protein
MTVNNIAFPVVAVQNKNGESTAFGKWFLRALYPDTLGLKGLIERVAWDQSVYSRDIIEGVIKRVTLVMVEQLQAGQPVKWEGLGTFRPTIENKNGGINAAKVLSGDFNVADQIEGVSIAFIPENAKGEALTSRKFRDLCVFEDVGIIETTAVPGNNGLESATKYFQKVIPGETWRKEANKPAPDPEPEP